MKPEEIEALLEALRLGLEGNAIDKITITISPKSRKPELKPKPEPKTKA